MPTPGIETNHGINHHLECQLQGPYRFEEPRSPQEWQRTRGLGHGSAIPEVHVDSSHSRSEPSGVQTSNIAMLGNCESMICKLLLPETLLTEVEWLGDWQIQKWKWNVLWRPTATTLTPHDQSSCCHSRVPSVHGKGDEPTMSQTKQSDKIMKP